MLYRFINIYDVILTQCSPVKIILNMHGYLLKSLYTLIVRQINIVRKVIEVYWIIFRNSMESNIIENFFEIARSANH